LLDLAQPCFSGYFVGNKNRCRGTTTWKGVFGKRCIDLGASMTSVKQGGKG
jgi:hypothetical protein